MGSPVAFNGVTGCSGIQSHAGMSFHRGIVVINVPMINHKSVPEGGFDPKRDLALVDIGNRWPHSAISA